jgi:hypothetical protein
LTCEIVLCGNLNVLRTQRVISILAQAGWNCRINEKLEAARCRLVSFVRLRHRVDSRDVVAISYSHRAFYQFVFLGVKIEVDQQETRIVFRCIQCKIEAVLC